MNRVTLAPTTLPSTPPLEFVSAAAAAGYEGLGLRLHKSPAYPDWVDWLGDAALKRQVKSALVDAGQEMVESLSYYLLPDLDLDEMKPSLEYAAELGATYALVIGRDDDWSRQRDHFAAFCEVVGSYGLTAAIEAPVGTLSPIAAAFRVIEETRRQNAVVCIDPTAFMRAGDTPEMLRGRDPRLLPYTQINDGKRDDRARLRPGDGDADVDKLLNSLPTNLPLSLEWPAEFELHGRGLGQVRARRYAAVSGGISRVSATSRGTGNLTGVDSYDWSADQVANPRLHGSHLATRCVRSGACATPSSSPLSRCFSVSLRLARPLMLRSHHQTRWISRKAEECQPRHQASHRMYWHLAGRRRVDHRHRGPDVGRLRAAGAAERHATHSVANAAPAAIPESGATVERQLFTLAAEYL